MREHISSPISRIENEFRNVSHWHYRHTVLTLCACAFFVTYFARLAISPIVPLITSDLNISNAEIGLALTGMWFAYGFSQFPSGIVADKIGEKLVILFAVGGTTIASFLLSLSTSYVIFILFCLLLGGAAGFHYAVATTLLSRTYEKVGTAIGIHSLGGPLAGLVAPLVATWISAQYGWRVAISTVVLFGIPVFITFWFFIRPTEPRHPDVPIRGQFQFQDLRQILSNQNVILPLIIAIIGTYAVQGLLSFLPVFLTEHGGYSTGTAGLAFSGYFIVRAGGQIFLGRESDQYGSEIILTCTMLVGGVGFVLFVASSGFVALGIAVLFTGIGGSFFSAVDPLFVSRLSADERGMGFGLIRTVYTIVGSAGSVVVGFTADAFGWNTAFESLAILLFVAFILLALSMISQRTNSINLHLTR